MVWYRIWAGSSSSLWDSDPSLFVQDIRHKSQLVNRKLDFPSCFKEDRVSFPFSCSPIFSFRYREKVASHKYRQEVNFDKAPYSRYNEEKVTKDKSMTNSKYITRLKRSEGQLRGIQKMIEEDRDCADIVTQLTAVKSSVERVIDFLP